MQEVDAQRVGSDVHGLGDVDQPHPLRPPQQVVGGEVAVVRDSGPIGGPDRRALGPVIGRKGGG